MSDTYKLLYFLNNANTVRIYSSDLPGPDASHLELHPIGPRQLILEGSNAPTAVGSSLSPICTTTEFSIQLMRVRAHT